VNDASRGRATPSSRILIADDNPVNVDVLRKRLIANGFEILVAEDGLAALELARAELPDLILLDVMMPGIDGMEVCRQLKNDPELPLIPIILVTAKSDRRDVIAGLDAGAEEYLTKPVDPVALVARVRSMLRIKELHDESVRQSSQLELLADDLASLNRHLEDKVASQLEELNRLSQLKRFFSPQLAEHIVSTGEEKFLDSHRREIAVVFCDLRNFSEFSTLAAPDEQLQLLRQFHNSVGALIFEFEATLEHFAGDGIMAFFNDPVPCEDPAGSAVRMAIQMREAVRELLVDWNRRGYNLGFGAGISFGPATLGHVGFESQFHYAAIGPIVNLAARLCDSALDGQILVTEKVLANARNTILTENLGDSRFKGFHQPVAVHNVVALRDGESTEAAV